MRDYLILREYGKKLAEIAELPIQQEKRMLWTRNNSLIKTRPPVYIDQLPWHEINQSDEMKLECQDDFLRSVEWQIKSLLYRWNHFPCDMVVENWIDIPMTVNDLNYGIHIVEETLAIDQNNDVVSHKFSDQVSDENALKALKPDMIWVDREKDQTHLSICNEIFKDIIPVRLKGIEIHAGVWDRIALMRPAEAIILDLIDRPEFIKELVNKFVDLTMSTIDQCEELGILDDKMQYVHCTGAYNNELPANEYEQDKAKANDVWTFGMAQIFSTVSPAMHDEFEIELVKPLYERFGLLYYGCCEPLDNVIKYIRKINNVRKISISPWAKIGKCAEQIGKDYVFSAKPNPSYVATGELDKEAVCKQINKILEATKENDTPVELILKDISTVKGKIKVLDEWAGIVMDLVEV